MKRNLKDIVLSSKKKTDDQKLIDYLQNKLSAEDSYEVEKEMIDDGFTHDAIEGLQNFGSVKELQKNVEQLKKDLQKNIQKKKDRKLKRRWKDQPWIYVTILLLILLIIISFVVIKYTLSTN